MTTVRVADVRYPVTALGPGVRLGIWFQGCHIECPGCMSRDTWDPAVAPDEPVSALVTRALGLVDGRLDGITLSGGEPLEQPEALEELIDLFRDALGPRAASVDMLCYSGLPYAEIERSHPGVLARLDALIPEPYRAAEAADLPWRGSANQPILLLSRLAHARYAAEPTDGRPIQVVVSDGHVTIMGIPRLGDLARVERRIAAIGITLEDVSWRP